MAPRSAIDILALLAGSVYGTIPIFWLVIHPFISRWRKRGRRSYAQILPVWAAFVTAAFLMMWTFRGAHLYTKWVAWTPAAVFFLLGFYIYSAAFKSFSATKVSGLAELEPDRHRQQLVTTGIRSRVRHPIYLAHFCEIIGWCMGTGLISLYLLAAFAILTGSLMMHIEDGELETRFGEPFRAYRRSVPALIPRI